jgi:iron complex transport system substrate-binding protein
MTRSHHPALGARHARGLRAALAGGLLLALLPGGAAAQSGAVAVTVVDDEGTETVIQAAPQRIVSLAPASTEIVFALGAGERLVGGSSSDDFPAEAAALPDAASYEGVLMERLVDLEPDLVIAAGNSLTPPDDVARMRDLGYPVVVIYAEDVPGVLADIELIGAAIGAPEEASEVTRRMSADLEAVAAAAADIGTMPRTFYEVGYDTQIYAPAPDSFVADMVSLAGGDPITTSDATVWSIPLEELVVADPEVIVLGDANYGVCPDAVAARAGWGGMTAVVNGDVRTVDDVVVTRPGPRLAQGLASLARAIHPDLELAGFPADAERCAGA